MKKNNFSFCLILIFALSVERSIATPNCLVLMATNYFGFFNSCFIHAIESLREMIVFYTNTSVTGISFGLINGQNFSHMTNMDFTNSDRIDLTNTYLVGVEVWTGDNGISGLKFQMYIPATNKTDFTSLLGSTIGCYSYLNSTFMKSNFFRINSIGGCVDNYVQNEFLSLNFQYSFSQCPLYSLTNISTNETLTTSKTETTGSSRITSTIQISNQNILKDNSCIIKSTYY